MEIIFLGSSGVLGVPVWNCNCDVCCSDNPKDKRLRPSILVRIKDKNIVIDFGQDFRTQLLKYEIKNIDYALLTHAHRDHSAGLEQLSTAEGVIFEAPAKVLQDLNEREGSSMEWLKTRNKTITIRPFTKKVIEEVTIDIIELEHEKDYGDLKVPCYGYIFESENFKVAYISDYNKILEPEKLINCDLIISDGAGIENTGKGHVGIKGSVEIYKELKPKKMILTHLNHSMSHNDMVSYVSEHGNIDIAYDGMKINF